MALAVGTRLGPYEVLALIGAGGMGEVYRARDTRLGREVAIKVLPADRLADEQRRQRFVQEARAASALNHPNIVTIYEIESADGIDFIVRAGAAEGAERGRGGVPTELDHVILRCLQGALSQPRIRVATWTSGRSTPTTSDPCDEVLPSWSRGFTPKASYHAFMLRTTPFCVEGGAV